MIYFSGSFGTEGPSFETHEGPASRFGKWTEPDASALSAMAEVERAILMTGAPLFIQAFEV